MLRTTAAWRQATHQIIDRRFGWSGQNASRRMVVLGLIALTGLVSFAGSCTTTSSSPLSDGGTATSSLAVDACTKARVALASVRSEGLSNRVYSQVEDFLAAARSAGQEDQTLLYQAMQVADAHRGSDPALTLGPSLENMVRFCDQGGY